MNNQLEQSPIFDDITESSVDDGAQTATGALLHVALTDISPNPAQPRKHFLEEDLQSLSRSISKHGVLQPVALREAGDGSYLIVAGERRYRAAIAAGLTTIPAIVKQATDRQPPSDIDDLELGLMENLQRQDLNDYEQATGITELLRVKLGFDTALETARLVRRMANKTLKPGDHERALVVESTLQTLNIAVSSFSSTHLTVLSLAPDLQARMRLGTLDLAKARQLNRIRNPEDRLALTARAIEDGWTASMLNRNISDYLAGDVHDYKIELELAEIAKRITVLRETYVKHRRRIPDKKIKLIRAMIENAISLSESWMESEEKPGSEVLRQDPPPNKPLNHSIDETYFPPQEDLPF